MSLKDAFKVLIGKKTANEQKNEMAAALIASDCFPVVQDADIDISRYRKLPLTSLAALGAAFSSLPDAARTITQTVDAKIITDTPLFRAVNPKNVAGYMNFSASGTVGNIMQINEQGQHVIAGRMRFQPVSGSLPALQSTTTVMPFNPTALFIAAALAGINQKLDALQERAEEILEFLKDEKRARQRGNLNMLSEIMNEYRQNCADEKMCALRVIAVQDIKREAHQDILFYQEQLEKQLKKQSFLHISHNAQTLLQSVMSEFAEYQLSCYLYAFTSFLETMLLKNFETAGNSAEKVRVCSERYDQLYAACREQIAHSQHSSIDAQLRGLTGQALTGLGVCFKGKNNDNILISAGRSLGEQNKNAVAALTDKLAALKDPHTSAFSKSLKTLDLWLNQKNSVLTDGEQIYMLDAE